MQPKRAPALCAAKPSRLLRGMERGRYLCILPISPRGYPAAAPLLAKVLAEVMRQTPAQIPPKYCACLLASFSAAPLVLASLPLVAVHHLSRPIYYCGGVGAHWARLYPAGATLPSPSCRHHSTEEKKRCRGCGCPARAARTKALT